MEADREVGRHEASHGRSESLIVFEDEGSDNEVDRSSGGSSDVSDVSVKVNPAFKKVISDPKNLLPSSPFKKVAAAANQQSDTTSDVANGKTSSSSSNGTAAELSSATISKHNQSNVDRFMKSSAVQWVASAAHLIYESNSSHTASHATAPASNPPATTTTPKSSPPSVLEQQSQHPLSFQELVDGVLLNDVMYDM